MWRRAKGTFSPDREGEEGPSPGRGGRVCVGKWTGESGRRLGRGRTEGDVKVSAAFSSLLPLLLEGVAGAGGKGQ